MRSQPPTRRSRRSRDGDSSLPIIPILIGVIVLGFVIGAGLSLAGRHDSALLAVTSPSPVAANVTLAPVTPAPTEKPTAEPTDGPADSPAPAMAAPRAPALTAQASPHPYRHREPLAAATAPRAAAATDVPPATPRIASLAASPSAAEPADSAAARSAEPVVTLPSPPAVASAATPAAEPAKSDGTVADSAFAKLSAAVVRQYLEAVKRGDQDAAYAALGASPGAKGATLSEASVIDSQTRVGHIDAHSAANDNALVSVQLQTANGPYYGQYTVHKTDTGAAVIVAHSIVKP